MKYCGIDLKGSEAIIACIETTDSGFTIICEHVKKITLDDPDDQASIKAFASDLYTFFSDHDFDGIAIKARLKKGKFAGGPTSFKMESIIQCCDYPVHIIPGPKLKAKFKSTELDTSEVNGYQEDALKCAIFIS